MDSTTPGMSALPRGLGVFTTLPDIFFIPELVFGGLVWILVASTKVLLANPQGWVMFVSVFCFVFTFLWFLLFMIGVNQSSPVWSSLDVAYHGIAALFYLSASVAQSSATIALQDNSSTFKSYQEDIAAVVFGGLVWILVASTNVYMDNPQGWVMFVSVFCFVFTFLWLLLFIFGMNQNSSMWATLDVAYHVLAAFFYLSASVALAYVTSVLGQVYLGDETLFKYYQEDIAAVVFSYITTLLYTVHAVMSARRWKSS